MKRIRLVWLAVVSFACAMNAAAATRPHYGGNLRIAIPTSLASLDPADPSNGAGTDIRNISSLLFDTLTILDSRGEVQPSLAVAWSSDFNSRRWEFQLRPGVTFSDGSAATSTEIAASLRYANPQWKISPAGVSLIIESDTADDQIPAELALPRNSILAREGRQLLGTGPFKVAKWDAAAKSLALSAREDYWNGRPFLDSVEITMGRSARDQSLSLDLGRIDAVELLPGQSIHTPSVLSSDPDELLALVFTRDAQSPEENRLREAFSASIDRALLNNVVLQNAGAPAGGLLPNWMTGYEFVFPLSESGDYIRQESAGKNPAPVWKLASDQSDPVFRLLAERIALNAQDAGIHVQLIASGPADITLMTIPLASRDSRVALSQLAQALRLPAPGFRGASIESLYAAENALLASRRIIPLLHLRNSIGLARNVRNWSEGHNGRWNLADVWLSVEKP